MQYVFLFILVGMLAVGVVVLAWLGMAQRRRRRLLARAAHEMGLMFSASDPFDLTRRYSDFVLSTAGHSGRAENVLYGRYEGWYLRVFDYCYEAGHGPGRLTRRCGVIVADTDLELPSALLWHADDAQNAPLAARNPVGRSGRWLVISGRGFAGALAGAFAGFADRPVNLQTRRRSVMVCSAARLRPWELGGALSATVAALAALQAEARAA